MVDAGVVISLFERWGVEHIRESFNQSKGSTEVWGCCPFHGESSPSFSINIESENWHCFSCKKSGTSLKSMIEEYTGEPVSGDIEKLTAKQSNDYADSALKIVREKMEERERGTEIEYEDDNEWEQYADDLSLYMIEDRGFSEEILSKYGIGYDERRDAVVIPVFENNKCVFMYRRAASDDVDKSERYRYPDGFTITHFIWGADDVRCGDEKMLVLTEGAFDALWLKQHGYRGSAALMGSRLTHTQLGKIKEIDPEEIVLFMDDDKAGWEANETIGKELIDNGFTNVSWVKYKGKPGLDPDKLSPVQIHRMIKSRKHIYALLLSHLMK